MEFVHYWNTHLIRKNKQCQTPSGIPDEMHNMPSMYGMVYSTYIGANFSKLPSRTQATPTITIEHPHKWTFCEVEGLPF